MTTQFRVAQSDTHIGELTRDRSGHVGTSVGIETAHQDWHGAYGFATHGMSAEQAVAKRDELTARHERKAAVLTDLSSLIGTELAGGYTITDATVGERGTDTELLCRARAGRDRIELRAVYRDPSDVPAAEAVLSLMGAKARAAVEQAAVHESHVREVRKALKLP